MSRQVRINANGGFGRTHNMEDDDMMDLKSRENSSEESDELDIDFSITESGRTVAHLIAHMKEDDNMDFSVTSSTRSVERLVSHVPGGQKTAQMDFTITHSGRGIESIVYEDPEEPSQVPTKSPAKDIPANNSTNSVPPSLLGPTQQASSHDSGAAFIHGIMDPGNGTLAHTPPSALGTSYETRHFGKRPRSGSVSGRLRSASDLEDKGIIDRNQKGVLKDLIIAGDEALQDALDKFEKGDTSKLESMIKSGALSGRIHSDIDLLGDLDLDFLTVEDTSLSQNIEAAASIQPTLQPQYDNNHAPSIVPATHTVTPSHNEDDGIGDLDFSTDFGGDDNYLQLPQNSYETKIRDGESHQGSRFRSNSLASGVLQGDDPGPMNNPQMYSRWMDREEVMRNYSDAGVQVARRATTAFAGSGGGGGGLGACLEEYNRSKSESAMKLSKGQMAQAAKRERLLKKEQREREKQEQKRLRELERQAKKELREREKQEQKEKKSAARKAKHEKKDSDEMDDEDKIVQSGTGRPRSMSDPNLKSSLDENGLLHVERPDGWVGAYSPESRKLRIERFMEKRNHRVWTKSVKYDVRKNFADSRLRVKGRFVKKEDELLMRELMSLT